jgi:hypothetical protein
MAESKKIYEAIAAIQAGVGNIPKNGIGPASQGSYKYVKNDDILDAISRLMVEHGVITRPVIVDREFLSREIGANRTVPLTVVDLEIEYIAIEDGSSFTVQVSAEGADNGDKGMRKAVTQAQKIANLLTFNIATGEPDPDGIEVTPVAHQASPAAQKVAKAKEQPKTSGTFNEIKAFLGANGLSGSVANSLGERLSGGKPSSEWSKDEDVLKQVLEALKAGEVE